MLAKLLNTEGFGSKVRDIITDSVNVNTVISRRATFENLWALRAEIHELLADYAEIDDLNALVARINNLSADDISTGILRSEDGSSYWNLDTGEISINGYIINARVEYALGNSSTVAPTTGWSTVAPAYESGKYMWQRTTLSKTGQPDEITTTCIQGANGADAILLRIDSSRGTVFKNNAVSTVLTVNIYYGEKRIFNRTGLTEAFGAGAYLQWEWLRMSDSSYGIISASDSRLSNDGFSFTLTPADVDTKVTFRCNLIL